MIGKGSDRLGFKNQVGLKVSPLNNGFTGKTNFCTSNRFPGTLRLTAEFLEDNKYTALQENYPPVDPFLCYRPSRQKLSIESI